MVRLRSPGQDTAGGWESLEEMNISEMVRRSPKIFKRNAYPPTYLPTYLPVGRPTYLVLTQLQSHLEFALEQ